MKGIQLDTHSEFAEVLVVHKERKPRPSKC